VNVEDFPAVAPLDARDGESALVKTECVADIRSHCYRNRIRFSEFDASFGAGLVKELELWASG
jgi:hypothetical protein